MRGEVPGEGHYVMKIGIGELLIVLAVALVIIGPDKLPQYAKKLGEAIERKQSGDLKKIEDRRAADREEVRRIVANDPNEQ